ncbi:MucBP domain-containing protein [uncultured Anaerofustis sp.]|uniref:MucBP domain-containing protein n=2 Tax=Anaerofustis TaxID=264995 RepID=UPI0025EBB57C|nr:MucBP domain-containing protein [uncultured Anaerofustis sp.]
MKKLNRVLSLMLISFMILSLIPSNVFAKDIQNKSGKTVSISYEKGWDDGVTGDVPDTSKYAVGETISIRTGTLARPNYRFAGWKYSNSSTNWAEKVVKAGANFVVPDVDTVFRPVWEKEPYKIKIVYHYENDKVASEVTYKPSNQTIESEISAFNVDVYNNHKPVRNGYTFAGWFVNSKDGRDYDKAEGITNSEGRYYENRAEAVINPWIIETNNGVLDLYAGWVKDGKNIEDINKPEEEKVEYTLEYWTNNGNGVFIRTTQKEGNLNIINKVPKAKVGYEFKEWNTKSNGSGTAYKAGDSFELNSNTKLYAIWQSNGVANFYVLKNTSKVPGSATPDKPSNYKHVGKGKINKAISKSIYDNTSENGVDRDGNLVQIPSMEAQKKALISAGYSEKDIDSGKIAIRWYVIKFDKTDGWHVDGVAYDTTTYHKVVFINEYDKSLKDNIFENFEYVVKSYPKVEDNTGVAKPDVNPYEEGYEFDGWYYGDGTKLQDHELKWVNKDIVVYAKFKKITSKYVIKYIDIDTKKEIKNKETLTGEYGSSLKVAAKDKGNIKGYTLVENNSEYPIVIDEILKNNGSDKNARIITFAYKANEHKVIYDANPPYKGAVVKNEDKLPSITSYKYNSNVEVSDSKGIEVKGYTFDGWTVKGLEDVTDIDVNSKFAMPDNNVTLSAKWKINQYTVIYDANVPNGGVLDGTVTSDKKYDFNSDVEVNGGNISVKGYSFEGYYDQYNNRYTDGVHFNMPAEDITLTAEWKVNDYPYVVHYVDTNNNKLHDDKNASADYGKKVTENAIDIKGYSPKSSTENITIDTENNEITFVYEKNIYNYVVHYVDTEGNKLSDDKNGNAKYDETITENAINIKGYSLQGEKDQSIKIDTENNEITFVYEKNSYDYIVHYVDLDGNTLSADKKGSGKYKETISEKAIDIKGYSVQGSDEQKIDIDVENNEITFVYDKNVYEYIVYYVDRNNNRLYNDKIMKAAFGDTVSEKAININGYELVSSNTQSIVIDTENNIIVFVYDKEEENNPINPNPVNPARPTTPQSTPPSTGTTTTTTTVNGGGTPIAAPAVNAPAANNPATTIDDAVTPLDNGGTVNIPDDKIPLAEGNSSWALINLLCTIFSVLSGLMLLIFARKKKEEYYAEEYYEAEYADADEYLQENKKRRFFTKILAAIDGVIALIVFILTEDMSLPMALIDKWTIFMVVFALISSVTLLMGYKNANDEAEEETVEA